MNHEQYKVEENNRMGKTGDVFRKTGDMKGTLYVRMHTIRDTNSKDLTEAD